jgi:hypothetical protein
MQCVWILAIGQWLFNVLCQFRRYKCQLRQSIDFGAADIVSGVLTVRRRAGRGTVIAKTKPQKACEEINESFGTAGSNR